MVAASLQEQSECARVSSWIASASKLPGFVPAVLCSQPTLPQASAVEPAWCPSLLETSRVCICFCSDDLDQHW